MRKGYIFFILFLLMQQVANAQFISGKVIDKESREPLTGALLNLKGVTKTWVTEFDGSFKIPFTGDSLQMTIRFIGYLPLFVNRKAEGFSYLFELSPSSQKLEEVVVNTGFQEVPLERATGSFVLLDEKLINRRVGEGFLKRLEDVTPGLLFNRGKNANGDQDISIRGRSTIFSANQPLIVVDGLAFQGDINSLNPNDIASVTILKDAAAASIYGVKAGNGVIVVSTKKGGFRKPITVNFNSNFSLGDRPDIFYQPIMSTADYIGIEQKLFGRDYYKFTENSATRTALSPVIELLIAQRDGKISQSELDAQLGQLKQQDVRFDKDKYLYRNSAAQQYAMNLQGGGDRNSYYFSLGFDKGLSNRIGDQTKRLNVLTTQKWSFFSGRMQLQGTIAYADQTQDENNPGTLYWKSGETVYPYAQLADDKGDPLPIIKDYKLSYLQSLGTKGLMGWRYYPLNDLKEDLSTTQVKDLRTNAQASYRLENGLSAKLLYSLQQNERNLNRNHLSNSYFTRNAVNQFTEEGSNGLIYHIPKGDILDRDLSHLQDQQLRFQIQYDKLSGDLDWHLLGGYEYGISDQSLSGYRQYGYDENHAGTVPVDYLTSFPRYYYPASKATVPFSQNENSLADRNRSYFANGAVTFKKNYTISASGRFDQSNIFGVATNQKGVPLYSIGAAWKISDGSFYHIDALPFLKLRLSYGYNGNINKSVTAYTTARYFSAAQFTLFPYADIQNPPNPNLRWERVKIGNLGIDFGSKKNRISGSIEIYRKNGIDLIGETPYAPSSGIETFTGNTASTRTNGFDIDLNTVNMKKGLFQWNTRMIVSGVKEIVTDYQVKESASGYFSFGDGGLIYPLEGKPLYSLYSLKWGGLKSNTGDPQGYLNGNLSTDYNAIWSGATADNIQYNGPARPTLFGALINDFTFSSFSLSANISYRFGYYFRKPSVVYGTVLAAKGGHADYEQRWQKSGDELFTQVPSEPLSVNNNRDNIYTYSDLLVEKGDHVRLQDIRLSYQLRPLPKLGVKNMQLYVYLNNLGILWKSAPGSIDPDYLQALPVRIYAFGFTLNL